jgi:hypothetical protein
MVVSDKSLEPRGMLSLWSQVQAPVIAHMIATRDLHGR